MLYEITHRSAYRYSQPVFLEPMTVMLRPRSDATQTVRSHDLVVTPSPSKIARCSGLDGNNTDMIWFSDLQDSLVIEVRTTVETHRGDTFDFLITDQAALTLPLDYEPHLAFVLGPYLSCSSNEREVAEFARAIMANTQAQTIPFVMRLAAQIHDRLGYLLREHGDPWTAVETLQRGQGSCRDFAVLFIAACRSVGLAARFVSGYCVGDVAADTHMHAWAEVYFPGGGWRGFDPSRGAAISDEYIAVAAGQRPQDAAPTFGSFRGEATATLEAAISIHSIDKAAARPAKE